MGNLGEKEVGIRDRFQPLCFFFLTPDTSIRAVYFFKLL